MDKFITKTKKTPTEKLDYTKKLLDDLFTIVDEMNSTTSSNAKKEIYKKYMKNEKYASLAELIQLVYHPLYRFHVTAKNARKFDKTKSKQDKIKNKIIKPVIYEDSEDASQISDSAIHKLLIALSSGAISGDTALATLNKFRHKFPDHQEHILLIVDKDLKMRFGIKQINKILVELDPKKPYSGVARYLIPNFEVSLGYAFDDKTKTLLPGSEPPTKKRKTKTKKNTSSTNEWYISRKLDGIRCVCIVKFAPETHSFDVTFYSRKGLEFTTLSKIHDIITEKVCPVLLGKECKNVVFDGELCILDEEGNEDFQSVMKELQREGHTVRNPKYLLFDYLSLEDFNALESTDTLSKRHKNLRELLEECDVPENRMEMVEQILYTPEKFSEMSKNIQSKENPKGWEGLILRKDTVYQGKRSKDILKVKKFHREEYKVVSVETGKMPIFNDKGMPEEVETLTAVHIEHKGYDVRVGSGFTHDERQRFYDDNDLIVGKLISVQFFEETKDKNGNISLRFPTYLGLYGKKRNL